MKRYFSYKYWQLTNVKRQMFLVYQNLMAKKNPLVFVIWGYFGNLSILFLLETIVKFSVLTFTCNTFGERHSLKLSL